MVRRFTFAMFALAIAFSLALSLALTRPAWAAPPQAAAPEAASDAKPDAKAEDELPPALQVYKGREIAPTMTFHGAPWLVRRERQEEEDCRKLLAALKVKPGQTVCDLGCGNGFYTLRLANLVGAKGKVLAVDIQPEMLSLLDENLKKKQV